ncbi:MAG: hypothetical protein QM501_10390 [Gimesia sp.]
MARFLWDLMTSVLRLSFYHAERREGVKYRSVVESWRRGAEVCLISVERGSIAFDKREHREDTRSTGSECSTDHFQKIDGFILRKSVVIQNIQLIFSSPRARRI